VHLREDIAPIIADATQGSLARKIEDIYSPEQNDRFIRISKADGTVLYVSGSPREQSFIPALIPLPKDYTNKAAERATDLRNKQHILLVGLKTTIDGGDYVLEMGTATTPAETALHKLIVTLLFSLPVIVLIAASGGALLIRRALRPVEIMRSITPTPAFKPFR
jgi:hypothetical protein